MNRSNKVLNFIKKFKNKEIYLNGNCYLFYLILKQEFPTAVAYFDKKYFHVVTNIDGIFYDCLGIVGTKNNYIKKEHLIKWDDVPLKLKKQIKQ